MARAIPTATIVGPTVSGMRAPILAAIAPIFGERDVIRIGKGSIARPACTGE